MKCALAGVCCFPLAALANEFGGPPFVVDVPSGRVRRVGDYSYHARPAGISRDGRRVLVADTSVELTPQTRVDVAPVGGGEATVVARFAGTPSWNG